MSDEGKHSMEAQQEEFEAALERGIGGALYGTVRMFQEAGMSPNESLRLAAFFVIENALGRDVTRSLGLPRATMTRWRRRISEAAQSERVQELAADDEYELEAINEVLPLLGLRDLRLIREEGAANG